MRTIVLFLISTLCMAAQEAPPMHPNNHSILEIGVTFPITTSAVKQYIEANGVTANPLTSGYSNGVELGIHGLISHQATVGLLATGNLFVANDMTGTNQIYQLGAYMIGRLYFSDTWRGGLFAELGSGLEFSLSAFHQADARYQANFGARIGAGYNYKFNSDVTIGASVRAAPSLSAKTITDGMQLVVSMLW